jgi:hypothetical protein
MNESEGKMAKKLPFSNLNQQSILTKDISFCSLSAQGLFINICSYYWQRNCKLSKSNFLLKRLNHIEELDELISEGAIDLMKTIFLSNFRLSVREFDKESKKEFYQWLVRRDPKGNCTNRRNQKNPTNPDESQLKLNKRQKRREEKEKRKEEKKREEEKGKYRFHF